MGKPLDPEDLISRAFSGKKIKSFTVHCSDEAYQLIQAMADLNHCEHAAEYLVGLLKADARREIERANMYQQFGESFGSVQSTERSISSHRFLRANLH